MARLLISVTVSLLACSAERDAENAPPDPTFTGSGACVSCHSAQAELWTGSHHDLAMQEATPESVLGDFAGARFEGVESAWTFSRSGAVFLARVEGPEEAPREHRVAYTFGAIPLQQYLVEFPGGRYQVLPIAWDSRRPDEGGQRWFDLRTEDGAAAQDAGSTPAQAADRSATRDAPHWTGPELNWNSMCAECHSTGVRKNYSSGSDRFSTEWAELDVACEACHGPGSGHVAWAESLDRGSPGPAAPSAETDSRLLVRFEPHDPGAWTLDPSTGTARPLTRPDPDGQLDACGRCHSRRSAISTRYRHGATLLGSHEPGLLQEGLYFADGQIRDEVYVWGSFVQSAMYRAGVTCNDCHDAHSLRLRDEGNATCAQCHAPSSFDTVDHHFHEKGTKGALCVSCHMPSRTYMGVDPRRDHSFRVPDPEVSEAVGAPDPCTSCHTGMTGAAAAAEIAERLEGVPIRRTRYYAEAIAAARRGDPESLPGLYALLRDPQTPSITKATALTLLGSDPSPERAGAVRRGTNHPDPIVRMGALRGIRLSPTREFAPLAAPLLDDPVRAVRLAAVEAVAPFAGQPAVGGRSLAPQLRSALAEGRAEYRDAQLAHQERPEAQLNLAWLATLAGALEDAETALEKAIAQDPTFVPAYVNLADLHLRTGRDPEGEPLLRSALDLSPRSADAHHALGLLLVRNGRADEAMASLQRAAELDSRGTRYTYVYAVALQSAGDTATARTELEQALARHPRDRDLLVALAVLHRDAGRTEEALRYARALAEAHPYDPAGPALIADLDG